MKDQIDKIKENAKESLKKIKTERRITRAKNKVFR